jgi:penicillin-binding protein 1A
MNFGYEQVIKKRKQMASKKDKNISKIFVHLLKFFIFSIAGIAVISVFIFAGMLKGMIDSAPDASTLNVSPTNYSTTVYDADGNVITTLLKSGSKYYI